jgi:hypothetical protein
MSFMTSTALPETGATSPFQISIVFLGVMVTFAIQVTGCVAIHPIPSTVRPELATVLIVEIDPLPKRKQDDRRQSN